MKKTRFCTLVLALLMMLQMVACAEEPVVYDLRGGTLDYALAEDATISDVACLKPTKDGYVFAGWYADAAYSNYVNPGNITKEQKKINHLFAKWIVVEETQTYDVRENVITVTDSGRKNQPIDQIGLLSDYNFSDLIRAGYSSISIKITMDIAEKDDGYQYVFLYKDTDCLDKDFSIESLWDKYVEGAEDSDPSCLYGFKHEHTPGELDESYQSATFKATLSLSSLEKDIYIRYGASGSKDDTWYNKNVVVTVELIK